MWLITLLYLLFNPFKHTFKILWCAHCMLKYVSKHVWLCFIIMLERIKISLALSLKDINQISGNSNRKPIFSYLSKDICGISCGKGVTSHFIENDKVSRPWNSDSFKFSCWENILFPKWVKDWGVICSWGWVIPGLNWFENAPRYD